MIENKFRYIESIHTFQAHENEVYLGVKLIKEQDMATGELLQEDEELTLVFSTLDVLLSGISDKPYLKKQFRKFVDKI